MPPKFKKVKPLQGSAAVIIQDIQDLGHMCALSGDVAYSFFDPKHMAKTRRIHMFVKLNTKRHKSLQQLSDALLQKNSHFFIQGKQLMYGPRTGYACSVRLRVSQDQLKVPQRFDFVVSDMPLVPFESLLLARLNWWHAFAQADQKAAASELLVTMVKGYSMLLKSKPLDLNRLLKKGQRLLKTLVTKFCHSCPTAVSDFTDLGFNIPPPPPEPAYDAVSDTSSDTLVDSVLESSSSTEKDHDDVSIEKPMPEMRPPMLRVDLLPHNLLGFKAATAAATTLEILEKEGFTGVIFGSLACTLYGTGRKPSDADILVLSPPHLAHYDASMIRQLIVERDPMHFYIIPPCYPKAPYEKLYYQSHDDSKWHRKVDILTPGLAELPDLSSSDIRWIHGLPVVPLPFLLLHKLFGWHLHSHGVFYNPSKRETDCEDIGALLELPSIVPLRFSRPWDSPMFSRRFVEDSKNRVKDLCCRHPELSGAWLMLGFDPFLLLSE